MAIYKGREIELRMIAPSGKGMPIEVETAAEMTEKLVATNVGKIFKYTGTTDATYTHNELYEVIDSETPDALQGEWTFKDNPTYTKEGAQSGGFDLLADFTCNDVSYKGFHVQFMADIMSMFQFINQDDTKTNVWATGVWQSETFKNIDVTSTAAQAATALVFLTATAVKNS